MILPTIKVVYEESPWKNVGGKKGNCWNVTTIMCFICFGWSGWLSYNAGTDASIEHFIHKNKRIVQDSQQCSAVFKTNTHEKPTAFDRQSVEKEWMDGWIYHYYLFIYCASTHKKVCNICNRKPQGRQVMMDEHIV